jgi:hypothetical protein
VGYYVYLWRHSVIDRYVGKGTGNRWAAHAKAGTYSTQRKDDYFGQHLSEMTCFIIVEGMTAEAGAAEREITEIDQRGLEVYGTGTLLNDRRGSVINGPRGRRDPQNLPIQNQLWKRLMARGRFTPNAILWRIGAALIGNPKKPGSRGALYLELYPPSRQTTTVAELLGGHLKWDYVHSFIELALPAGESTMPGYILPTSDARRLV